MKRLLPMLTLALLLMATGCGTWNVTGHWRATLTGKDASPSFVISMRLHDNQDGSVTVTELNFTNPTPCFPEGSTTGSGTLTINFVFGGTSTGTLALLIQSSSTDSKLAMDGTIDTIEDKGKGTWTLIGSTPGCTGVGTFTMHR